MRRSVSESEKLKEQLEAMALKYLERHDATAEHLKMVLGRKVRAAVFEAYSPALLRERIEELVKRYQQSGIIDDSRYAAQAIRRFRARGLGKSAIVHRLTAKGVASGTIEAALGTVDDPVSEPELEAARRLIKRRRLGRYRGAPMSAATRRKDLQALARAGFSYEIARQALGIEALEGDLEGGDAF
jgi:regulatory protein